MVGLQNAYAANARVLGTVQAMWDSLLATVR
jgi:flagellar hook-associated protein FlgK